MDYKKINTIKADGKGNITLQDINNSSVIINSNDTEKLKKVIAKISRTQIIKIKKIIQTQAIYNDNLIEIIHQQLSEIKRKNKIKTILLSLSSLLLIATIYFVVNDYLKPFSFIVSVKSSKNLNKNILKIKDDRQNIQISKGYIQIDLKGDLREEKISDKGKVFFAGFPAKYKNEKIEIKLVSDYFKIVKESQFVINDKENITLILERKDLGRIFGSVRDVSLFLDSVSVSIDDLKVWTDKSGYFELIIPQKRQKEIQIVTFFKKGYTIEEVTISPLTQQAVKILMTKNEN